MFGWKSLLQISDKYFFSIVEIFLLNTLSIFVFTFVAFHHAHCLVLVQVFMFVYSKTNFLMYTREYFFVLWQNNWIWWYMRVRKALHASSCIKGSKQPHSACAQQVGTDKFGLTILFITFGGQQEPPLQIAIFSLTSFYVVLYQRHTCSKHACKIRF